MKNRFTAVIILLCVCCHVLSQENKNVYDSTVIIRDSIVYNSVDSASQGNASDTARLKSLEKFTSKSRMARFLQRALFVPLRLEAPPPVYEGKSLESAFHEAAQGKIIGKIQIITLDPFGFNVRDTSERPRTVLFRTGNAFHSKTNIAVVRNLLLFRSGDRYDSLIVKESERLLRSSEYIRDIYLTVERSSQDSVDLGLRVIDVWSILPFVSRNSHETNIGLADLNFAGTGNRVELADTWLRNRKGNYGRVSLLMPNIRNSHISLNVQFLLSPGYNLLKIKNFGQYFFSPVSSNPQYMFSLNSNIIRSIELNRPFFSPVAKWAGGVFYGQIMTTQSWLNADTLHFISERTNIQDYWLGRSWRLGLDRKSERITAFILSGRIIIIRNPHLSPQSVQEGLFQGHNYFFGSVSIASRKYYRDKYIFNYGKVEDVPAGRIAGITLGEDFQERNRLYLGLYAGLGNYYKFGYFGTYLSYGTFKNNPGGFRQGILTGRITYFTRLMSLADWRIRLFIRPTFIFGINKSPTDNQPLNLGIKGFEVIESRASSISIVSLQIQTYAPWNIAGFHFGPYLFAHVGLLGDEAISASRLFSLFGMGVLIKNDYLMFNTFQVSFSFYPYIPGNRYNIFKANSYKTSDYGFRDFEVTRPGIVE